MVVLFLLLTLTSVVLSGECRKVENYWLDRERGWFWKEVCEPKKEEKKEAKREEKKEKTLRELSSNRVVIPWDRIERLDPEEIAKLEQKSRKIAIMYPTEENVREYYKLQRFIVEKSRNFALQVGVVSRTMPAMFQRPQYPVVRELQWEERQRKLSEVFSRFRNRAGIVVVSQKDCPYCQAFSPVLRAFAEDTLWQTREVYMEENPQLAVNLGTELTPDIFLVINRNGRNEWHRIGSGFMPLEELKRSVLFGLYRLGEIRDERLILGY
ncbi:MAG: conjugal transfer protein TraF [Aquificaceae bacterium]